MKKINRNGNLIIFIILFLKTYILQLHWPTDNNRWFDCRALSYVFTRHTLQTPYIITKKGPTGSNFKIA